MTDQPNTDVTSDVTSDDTLHGADKLIDAGSGSESARIDSHETDDAAAQDTPDDHEEDGATVHDDELAEDAGVSRGRKRRLRPSGRVTAATLLPIVLLLLAAGAGYLKYQDGTVRDGRAAAITSVKAATDATVTLLSYAPDTAQATLTQARDLLTGEFRDAYTSLTNDVVIPGAKEKRISATATVPAAASVSASENHAVVLVFVDQVVVVGNDAPSGTASAVQVTLDKTGNRWLISGFDPK